MAIQVNNLSKALVDELLNYSDEVAEKTKKAVDIVASEVNSEIKSHVTFKQISGDYVKAFAVKTTHNSRHAKIKLWYVNAPQYRLTHLLEHGHALVNGGRTKAFKHIQYGEELAVANLPKQIKEMLQ